MSWGSLPVAHGWLWAGLSDLSPLYWLLLLSDSQSNKKRSRHYRKCIILYLSSATGSELQYALQERTQTSWVSASTRMTSPWSNWSRPSSDAAWLSNATPWWKTQVTLMQALHWQACFWTLARLAVFPPCVQSLHTKLTYWLQLCT